MKKSVLVPVRQCLRLDFCPSVTFAPSSRPGETKVLPHLRFKSCWNTSAVSQTLSLDSTSSLSLYYRVCISKMVSAASTSLYSALLQLEKHFLPRSPLVSKPSHLHDYTDCTTVTTTQQRRRYRYIPARHPLNVHMHKDL